MLDATHSVLRSNPHNAAEHRPYVGTAIVKACGERPCTF